MNSVLQNIDSSEHLISMTPVEKIIEMGHVLNLDNQSRILDLCCGYGEMLRILSKYYGCSGIGVDTSREFIAEGRKRIDDAGLSDKVTLELQDARKWDKDGYDVACLVGEQNVFGGFENTLRVLMGKIKHSGKVVIGAPYYHQKEVPQELIDFEGDLETEKEIFDIVKANDCIITFIGRDTRAEWDRYISWSTRRGLSSYRSEQGEEEKLRKLGWMHHWHDMYLDYRLKYEGWAIYAIEKT